ncbi:MAG: metallophosphoesterase family protein [Candidatus Eremiobacteraeota bacterium]|nr:metallophosphoesterase family protein [Candidatus Eremiobacteraeota bacterium]
MRVLFMVDLHWGGQRGLEWPDEQADLVLLGGDLTNFCGGAVAAKVIDAAASRYGRVMAVCGNCDLPEAEATLRQLDVDLDGRARDLEGVRFLGLSGGLPFGNCPYERSENDYRDLAAELFAEDHPRPLILVSHQPPHGVACDLTRGRHVGSTALRQAIQDHQPDLVLSGHIHEGIGTDQVGRTTVANPGPWMARRYLTFDVDSSGVKNLVLHHS